MKKFFGILMALLIPGQLDGSWCLPGGNEYAYEGAPVTPEIKLKKTDYDSGVRLEDKGRLTIAIRFLQTTMRPERPRYLWMLL